VAARVLYRDAQGRTGEVALAGDVPCYIGRALDCAVRTDDAMVSRKHSLIRMENGRFLVEDLGSSNGTHVNDIKVSRQTLNHNDVVRCGNLWLRYIDDGTSNGAPDAAQDSGGTSSKYRNTLGGEGQREGGPKVAPGVPATDDTPPSPPPPPPSSTPLPTTAPRHVAKPPVTAPPETNPPARSPVADHGPSPASSLSASPPPPPPPGAIPPTIIRPSAAPSPPPPMSAPMAPTPTPAPTRAGTPSPVAGNAGVPDAIDSSQRPSPGPIAATVIRPDGHAPGKPIPRRQQSPHAEPIAPAPPKQDLPQASYETDPVGSLPREELERRLDVATARATEVERGLLTLQAELETAQHKIKALLASIRELSGIYK
jgi:hypothetical protein